MVGPCGLEPQTSTVSSTSLRRHGEPESLGGTLVWAFVF